MGLSTLLGTETFDGMKATFEDLFKIEPHIEFLLSDCSLRLRLMMF